jgi:hypothetical protein
LQISVRIAGHALEPGSQLLVIPPLLFHGTMKLPDQAGEMRIYRGGRR